MLKRIGLWIALVTMWVALVTLAACGMPVATDDGRNAEVEQRWTNVAAGAIGPTTCISPYAPMTQAWPTQGWCEFVPWYNVNSTNSPWWRVSSCVPTETLPRATVEITVGAHCVRLWGALTTDGTFFDFDITGAFGYHDQAVGSNPASQMTGVRVAADTFASFCSGPMSQGNACQPTNPPNIPETSFATESSEESATFNVVFKPVAVHVKRW